MHWNNRYELETIPGKIYLHISESLSIKTVRVCKVALVETMKLYGEGKGTTPPILTVLNVYHPKVFEV